MVFQLIFFLPVPTPNAMTLVVSHQASITGIKFQKKETLVSESATEWKASLTGSQIPL